LKSFAPHRLIVIPLGISLLLFSKPLHANTLTGCAVSSPPALTLQNEGDQQIYGLLGDSTGIKTGDRIKVSGKKKKDSYGKKYFLVEKLLKVYGPCKSASVAP
jgi:hypothetical protein